MKSWSGFGYISGWFCSSADTGAPITILPPHTNSPIQVYLPGILGPCCLSFYTAKGFLYYTRWVWWIVWVVTDIHCPPLGIPLKSGLVHKMWAKVTCIVSAWSFVSHFGLCLFPFALGPDSNWCIPPGSHKVDQGDDGQNVQQCTMDKHHE